ncbi:MAG: FtsW/RodA/SpoVE family cell cycle protein [Clostridia bacterium]|nr:FtsW/RodA/SpoVE family cell cycle protein [Clostridia bacterium]
MQDIADKLTELFALPFFGVLGQVLRFALPVLAIVIVVRCACSLFVQGREPEVWAWLTSPAGEHIPIMHWESLLGRGNGCDVQLNYPTISRTHAVLTRFDDGSWLISDAGSKGGVQINGGSVLAAAVHFGDVISLGGVDFTLVPITKEQEKIQAATRTRGGSRISQGLTLLILTVFQLCVCYCSFTGTGEQMVLPAFLMLIGIEWCFFALLRLMRRSSFEVETLAFLLTTMGTAVVASSAPTWLMKQALVVAAGVILYLLISWSLRNLERAKRIRYLASAVGLGLMAINALLGVEQFGARNWVQIGGISFQPSELVKLCFVFVGSSTLDRLMAKRNLILFIGYSAAICGCLAMMNDFGTAIIFFVAFLVIAFMRSGNFATIALALSATAFAGFMVLKFKPYALNRLSAWGHVWDYALTTGYSQTRAMMCIASGGLFGLGAGNGWLHYVGAADTDLVFALVSEEWGLILAMIMIAVMVLLAVFVVRSAPGGRSCFYTIGATAAVTILCIQTFLNVFGTVDFIPLTGVTFPFVSNGGSSLLCVWGLLAFIKAADTRQNASLAIKLPGRKGAQA